MLNHRFIKLLFVFVVLTAVNCGSVIRPLGISLYYRKIPSTNVNFVPAVPYTDAHDNKQSLNLFLPQKKKNVPILVFVHGGGWDSGDRDLLVSEADIYSNIGRLYASHGFATAVISYRLLPKVSLDEQTADVARAILWLKNNAAHYHADPQQIYVMGHSAGSHLLARALFKGEQLVPGFKASLIQKAVLVSGAAYDLEDPPSFPKPENLKYFANRFGKLGKNWKWETSVAPLITKVPTKFLIVYALGELRSLQRQSEHFQNLLQAAGNDSKIIRVKGQSHEKMALVLSRSNHPLIKDLLDFL